MPTERFSLEVGLDSRKLKRGATEGEAALGRLRGAGLGVSKLLVGLGAGVAFSGLVRSIVQTGAKFEGLRVRLETVTGSAALANREFDKLKRFAQETPFQVENLTSAYTNLRAKGFEPTQKALRALGDMAAAFGLDITQATQAVTQAAFGEAEMLKQFGIIMRQQGEQVSITYDGMTRTIQKDSAEIFRVLTELAEVNFAGGMVRQSQTLEGRFSTLKDAWASLLDSLARSGINDAIKDGVIGAIRVLERLEAHLGGGGVNSWQVFKSAALTSMADIHEGIGRFNASVLRRTGDLIAKFGQLIDDAPLFLRLIMDPFGAARSAVAVDVSKFTAAADEIERKTRSTVDALRDLADQAIEPAEAVDNLTRALENNADSVEQNQAKWEAWRKKVLDAQLEAIRNFYEELERLTELLDEGAGLLDRFLEADSVANLPENFGDAFLGDFDEWAQKAGEQLEERMTEGMRNAMQKAKAIVAEHMGAAIQQAYFDGFNADDLRPFFANLGADLGRAFAGPFGEAIGAILGDLLGKVVSQLFGGQKGPQITGNLVVAPGFGAGASGFDQLADWAEYFNTLLSQLEQILGESLEITEHISLVINDLGEIWVTINGAAQQFDSMQDAMEHIFAQVLATANLSGEVAQALEEMLRSGKAIQDVFADLRKLAELPLTLLEMGNAADQARAAIIRGLGQFARLRSELEAMGLSAEALAPLLEQVDRAQRRYTRSLRVNVLGQLADLAEQFGVQAEFVVRVRKAEAKIQFAILRAQLIALGIWEKHRDIWRELRNLALEAAEAVGQAAESFERFQSSIPGGFDSGGGGIEIDFPDVVPVEVLNPEEIAAEWERKRREVEVDLRRAHDRLGLSGFTADVVSLEHDIEDFLKGLRDQFGNAFFPEDLDANIQEMIQRVIQPLSEAIDDLSSYGGATAGIDAFRARVADMREALARLADQGVDVTAMLKRLDLEELFGLEELKQGTIGGLLKFFSGTELHQDKIVNLQRMQQRLELEALKAQLIALGIWDEWADVWKDAVDIVEKGVDAIAASLRDALAALDEYLRGPGVLGGDSPLAPLQQVFIARKAFEDAVRAARGGDVEALRNLPGLRDQLLGAARGSGAFDRIWRDSFLALRDLQDEIQAQLDRDPPLSIVRFDEGIDRQTVALVSSHQEAQAERRALREEVRMLRHAIIEQNDSLIRALEDGNLSREEAAALARRQNAALRRAS